MGWHAKPKRTRDDYLAMTPEERTRLTASEAREFMPVDTLTIASWKGRLQHHASPKDALDKYFGVNPR